MRNVAIDDSLHWSNIIDYGVTAKDRLIAEDALWRIYFGKGSALKTKRKKFWEKILEQALEKSRRNDNLIRCEKIRVFFLKKAPLKMKRENIRILSEVFIADLMRWL